MSIFQILIVLSSDPLASIFEDIKSTDDIPFLCPANVRTHSPFSIFQILIVPSHDPVASLFGVLNSTDDTA